MISLLYVRQGKYLGGCEIGFGLIWAAKNGYPGVFGGVDHDFGLYFVG